MIQAQISQTIAVKGQFKTGILIICGEFFYPVVAPIEETINRLNTIDTTLTITIKRNFEAPIHSEALHILPYLHLYIPFIVNIRTYIHETTYKPIQATIAAKIPLQREIRERIQGRIKKDIAVRAWYYGYNREMSDNLYYRYYNITFDDY